MIPLHHGGGGGGGGPVLQSNFEIFETLNRRRFGD
jgi:hypothetical protein